MRVVVLGGTRFIGRAITEDLAAAGHDVLVVHRGRSEPADLVAVEHAYVDRNDEAALRDVLAGTRVDGLIDTCASTRSDAETAIRALPGALRLVVLSSMDVYHAFGVLHAGAESDPLPLDESSPVRSGRYPYRGKLPGMDDAARARGHGAALGPLTPDAPAERPEPGLLGRRRGPRRDHAGLNGSAPSRSPPR